MPRRNNRPRRTPRWLLYKIDDEREMTYEQIARDLVKRGVCSPMILDRPHHAAPTTTGD